VVEDYTILLIEELKLQKLRKPILIIDFVNKQECYGLCSGDKSEVTITIAKFDPYNGRKLGFIEMMLTLAHEMVHAKQILRGELICEPHWIWKGHRANGYAYKNQPWEREAYKMEKPLFLSCFPISASFSN
jgi:hypothetical protein